MSRLSILASGIVLLSATSAWAAPAPASENVNVTQASPPGITLRVIRIGYGVNPVGSNSNQPRDRVVFADDRGWILYTWDKDTVPGKSMCDATCAKTWPPALAPADAKPVGQWTLVARDDGSQQWAFQGHPLYTFVAEQENPMKAKPPGAVADIDGAKDAKKEGAPVATPVAAKESEIQNGNNNLDAAAAAAALGRQGGEGRGHEIEGHLVVELLPAQWVPMPVGITATEVRTAPGQVLTNDEGLPLYVFTGKDNDATGKEWKPVIASHLALPIGDFSLVQRKDGALQWAYKKQPLYSFAGDLDLGDANGRYTGQPFQLVYFMKYFMPENVTIVKDRTFGGLLTTKDGKTIFVREDNNGGVDGALRGDRGKFKVGAKIGISGCDAVCQKTWQPLLAPAGALPNDYWTLYDRPDGTKQWAYFGYAAYTHNGPIESTEVYDAVDPFEKTADGKPRQSIPMHWRVAPP